jgi:hypothetical protein
MIPRSIPPRFLAALLAGGALAAVAGTATAASAGQIPNALVISKSSNRNQVHYAVAVDGACVPVGASPVHPYWRMFERGTGAVEELRADEANVLGVARQAIQSSGVSLFIRGLPQRPITIRTWRDDSGTCASSVNMTIAGVPARVSDVHVQQSLFGVSYVEITGVSPSGALVRERVHP